MTKHENENDPKAPMPDRLQMIRDRLSTALSPTRLEVEDQSHLHAGHAGTKEHGGGHFVVRIASPAFAGKGSVERHRMVHEALADMMLKEIHALKIVAVE